MSNLGNSRSNHRNRVKLKPDQRFEKDFWPKFWVSANLWAIWHTYYVPNPHSCRTPLFSLQRLSRTALDISRLRLFRGSSLRVCVSLKTHSCNFVLYNGHLPSRFSSALRFKLNFGFLLASLADIQFLFGCCVVALNWKYWKTPERGRSHEDYQRGVQTLFPETRAFELFRVDASMSCW